MEFNVIGWELGIITKLYRGVWCGGKGTMTPAEGGRKVRFDYSDRVDLEKTAQEGHWESVFLNVDPIPQPRLGQRVLYQPVNRGARGTNVYTDRWIVFEDLGEYYWRKATGRGGLYS